jgi:hypothetical protein
MSYSSFKLLKYDEDAFTWKQKAFAGKLKQIAYILNDELNTTKDTMGREAIHSSIKKINDLISDL